MSRSTWTHGCCDVRGCVRRHVSALAMKGVGMHFRLVTGSDDGTARVWNVATGECERVLTGHTGGAVHTVAFDPVSSHRRIVSGGNDRSARVWQGNVQQLLLEHIRGGTSLFSEFV